MPSYNRSIAQRRKSSGNGFKMPIIRRVMKRNAIEKCLILSIDGSIIGNEDLLTTLL
jgi:uncharacterized protein